MKHCNEEATVSRNYSLAELKQPEYKNNKPMNSRLLDHHVGSGNILNISSGGSSGCFLAVTAFLLHWHSGLSRMARLILGPFLRFFLLPADQDQGASEQEISPCVCCFFMVVPFFLSFRTFFLPYVRERNYGHSEGRLLSFMAHQQQTAECGAHVALGACFIVLKN